MTVIGALLPADDCHFAVEQFFPEWRMSLVRDLTLASDDLEHINRVTCSMKPIRVGAERSFDFVSDNEGSLFVLLGTGQGLGLHVSHAGAVADEVSMVKVWRRVAAGVRKYCFKGAWAINPAVGVWGFYSGHLYTPGALALFQHGTPMRQGDIVFSFGRERPEGREVPGL